MRGISRRRLITIAMATLPGVSLAACTGAPGGTQGAKPTAGPANVVKIREAGLNPAKPPQTWDEWLG